MVDENCPVCKVIPSYHSMFTPEYIAHDFYSAADNKTQPLQHLKKLRTNLLVNGCQEHAMGFVDFLVYEKDIVPQIITGWVYNGLL